MALNFISVQCPKCHQYVPYDDTQRVCFCMYCGTLLIGEECVPPNEEKLLNIARELLAEEEIIGVDLDEFVIPDRGLVVVTRLVNSVSVGDNVVFINSDGITVAHGKISAIEHEHTLITTAHPGMEVGLLVPPDTLHDLVGRILAFDR